MKSRSIVLKLQKINEYSGKLSASNNSDLSFLNLGEKVILGSVFFKILSLVMLDKS